MAFESLDHKSHVLVTGVTGLIGGEVLRELARGPVGRISALIRPTDEIDTHARFWQRMHRSGDSAANYAGLVDVVAGDVLHPRWQLSDDDWREVTETVDVIVHCAADTSFLQSDNVEHTNVAGMTHLIELAGQCRRKPLVVYMSTATNVGCVASRCLSEQHGCRPNNRHFNSYTRSKAIAESMLRDSGLDFLVLRPSIVLSAGLSDAAFARNILWFSPLLSQFECLPIAPDARLDIVTSSFVAEATVGLLESHRRRHSCYHVSAGAEHCVTNAQVFQEIARYYCSTPVRLVGPDEWTRREYRAFVRTPQQRKIFYGLRYYLPFFNMDVVYDNHRLLSDLGPAFPTIEPLEHYADSLLDQIEIDDAYLELSKP